MQNVHQFGYTVYARILYDGHADPLQLFETTQARCNHPRRIGVSGASCIGLVLPSSFITIQGQRWINLLIYKYLQDDSLAPTQPSSSSGNYLAISSIHHHHHHLLVLFFSVSFFKMTEYRSIRTLKQPKESQTEPPN